MEINIRKEEPNDFLQTKHVIKEAFLHAPMRSGTEHIVVERLRSESTYNPNYSLVATEKGTVVGHVMLSQAFVINGKGKTPILSLGPVSVARGKQRRGIGKKLIGNVLEAAKGDGEDAVIVLGHPTYYPKFGFKPASTWGITLPFQAPDEAFLALELMSGGLQEKAGVVEYSPAFYGN